MQFWGFVRPDGTVGTRNHVLVMPTVVCANKVAECITALVNGTTGVAHQHGCAQLGRDLELTIRTLVGTAANPNVYGVVLVGLGCEAVPTSLVAEALKDSGKPVRELVIQDHGGTLSAIAAGARMAMELSQQASCLKRELCDLSHIILGTECGGSDSCSGISANPALGLVSDRVTSLGGTVILAETTELIGAEHVLARRSRDESVRNDLLKAVLMAESQASAMGVDMRGSQPTPGNIQGGITTIAEKSLGCIYKAGSGILEEVVGYATRPNRQGLIIMDTPGHDIEQMAGMVAGGATAVIFTTGRGTPTGSPVVPVIKVSTTTDLYLKMNDNIDVDAGGIIRGTESLDSVAGRLFAELVDVCSGKLTRSELLKHNEFGIYRIGPTI